MRYEFERDGNVVASVLWEGPGQVSVEAEDSSVRSVVDRYLSSEVVYLGSGFDFGEEQRDDVLQMRRRDWTPWGVRAGVPEPVASPVRHREARRDRPGRGAHGGGGRQMKVTGAQALFKSLEGEGVDIVFGIPAAPSCRRTTAARLQRASRAVPSRAGRRSCRRGIRVATGKVGVAMAHPVPGGCNLCHRARRRQDGLRPDGGDHRSGADPRRGQRRVPGRPTSPASRCRSRSTTCW
jgi:hypothetical protein